MKKFLAIVLALACVLSLCACGGKTGNNGSTGNNGGTTAEGKVKLSIGIPSDAMVLDHKNNALTKWVEEQCNVDIQFIEFAGGTDVATQISTTIAARQDLPDILFGLSLRESVISRYGEEGYFVDLTDYYADKEGASKTFWTRLENELSEYDQGMIVRRITDNETGSIYCVPTVETSLLDKIAFMPWINQTWLDKLNLKAPTNPDELFDVLIAFRDKDPNGNGLPDEIPLMGSANSGLSTNVVSWIINMFMYYDSAKWYNVGADGKVYEQFTQPEYREALKFINKLYKEKLLSSITWTMGGGELKQMVTPASGTELCGIVISHMTTGFAPGNEIMYQYVPLGYWGNVIRNDTTCSLSTFITESCDNPDKAFEVLMALWSWEGSMRVRYGEYGVNWTDCDPGAKSDIGLDATYKLISDPLMVQNTAKWGKIASCLNVYAEGETAQISENMDKWTATKSKKHAEAYALFLEAEEKTDLSQRLPVLSYTQEENDRVAQYVTNVGNYRSKALANFCMGVAGFDPNSDTDWNNYLKELDKLGRDIYLDFIQTGYDRGREIYG